jgi:Tfp pilus assembly protein PilF
MNGFLKGKQKTFRIVAGGLIYCLAVFPLWGSTCWSAPAPVRETMEMSAREKQDLVRQGVEQYKQGNYEQAQKNLEQVGAVFPENYAVPYYLGLIYLEQGKRSATIAQWRQYVEMAPESENAMRIRKNLTTLLREEARESARMAVANEAALICSPAVEDTVAISTFNNLGSEDIRPLGKAMAALLIHDLSQVPDLQVVERVRLQALLKEMKLGTSGLVAADTAPRVGKLLKAKHVTSGTLADLEKESLQIASALVDADRAAGIENQEAQGQLKKFYDLEKDIACQIVEDLDRSCDDAPPAFHKIHTKSLAALLLFGAGLNYLDEENDDQARASFQKAVVEDPSFELAQEALLDTPAPALQFGAGAAGTTAEMIAMADVHGVSAGAAGTAIVAGVGKTAGGVGVLPAVGLIAGGAAVVGIAANAGDSDGGSPVSESSTPVGGSGTPVGQCNDIEEGRWDEPFEKDIEMNQSSGSFIFEYETRIIPDEIIITQDGEEICGTDDCEATGEPFNVPRQKTCSLNGRGTRVHVRVIPNCDGSPESTYWYFRVNCP